MTSVTLTINDKVLQVARGSTILQAAQQNGIDIPTLCAYKDLPPFGGCRMCVVEVDNMRGFPTACTTPAEDGMVVRTETPALQSLRLETFNLLLSEHPLSCLVCPENGNCTECMMTIRKGGVTTGCGSCPKNNQCELQTLSKRLGVDDIRLPVKYRMYPVEKYDPFYDRDYNLCILCGRCVQVCEKLHFLSTLTFKERGARTVVGTAFERSHVDAGCSFCGACVDRCPVGALTEKTRKWEGVADREVESTCPYCSVGCSIKLQIRGNMVIGSLPGDHNNLCVHGRFGISEVVNHPTRLRQPWRLTEGRKFECTWDEAIELAAEKFSSASSETTTMHISPNLPVEDLYVARKFATRVLHLKPIMGVDTTRSTGFDRLSKRVQAFSVLRDTDCLLIAGLDTRYTFSWLEYDLKKLRAGGVTLISVNNGKKPIDQFVDAFLYAREGQAGKVIIDLQKTMDSRQTGLSMLEKAAAALRASQHPFILVGPEYLDDEGVMEEIANLADKINASVICLPLAGNFYGARISGALGLTQPEAGKSKLQYCIGMNPISNAGFTIYQHAFPAVDGLPDLGLPTTLFTERDGTFINAELSPQRLNKAVEPVGNCLSDWQIIASIAKKMGAPGFDFNSTEEIYREILSTQSGDIREWGAVSSLSGLEYGLNDLPVFMGSPLSRYVPGLRALYPHDGQKEGGQ